MQAHSELYKQASVLVAAGAGVYLLRRHGQKASHADHPSLSNAEHVQRHANLSRLVVEMTRLQQPALLARLVALLDDLASRADDYTGDAQHRLKQASSMNALIIDARQRVDDILRAAKKSRDDSVAIACVDVDRDVLPAFEGIFDAMLHNAMLDAQT